MWTHEYCRLIAVPGPPTVACEEEQAEEDRGLTARIEQEKAQQAWEDEERSRQIEREKQEPVKKPPRPPKPPKPKPKR